MLSSLKRINLILALLVASVIARAQQPEKFDMFLTRKLNMPQNIEPASAVASVSSKITNSLTAADSSRTVVTKIIDSSLSYWWETSGIRNTSVGQAVDNVQNKLKADVDLGSSNDAEKTKHKLTFRFLAAQAMAKIEYIGWVRAVLKYDAKTANAEAELLENLSNNKDLVISHSFSNSNLESKSQVSFRWNW